MSLKKFIVALCALGMVSSAHAGAVYDFSLSDLNSVNTSGVIENISGSYSTNNSFSFSTTMSRNSDTGLLANSGWVVLSPGGMPRSNVKEQAILYFDYDRGDVYAYSYDGSLGGNTYSDRSNYITTYEGAINVTSDGNTFTASIEGLDVSAIQGFSDADGWTGVGFGETVGIWAHFSVFDEFQVVDGEIVAFDPGTQSFFDTTDPVYTQVPEPAGLALFGLMVAGGVIAARRRKQAQA